MSLKGTLFLCGVQRGLRTGSASQHFIYQTQKVCVLWVIKRKMKNTVGCEVMSSSLEIMNTYFLPSHKWDNAYIVCFCWRNSNSWFVFSTEGISVTRLMIMGRTQGSLVWDIGKLGQVRAVTRLGSCLKFSDWLFLFVFCWLDFFRHIMLQSHLFHPVSGISFELKFEWFIDWWIDPNW